MFDFWRFIVKKFGHFCTEHWLTCHFLGDFRERLHLDLDNIHAFHNAIDIWSHTSCIHLFVILYIIDWAAITSFTLFSHRTTLHMTKGRSESRSSSLQNTRSNHPRSRSKRRSTTPTLTRRDRSACLSLVQRTGNQPPKLTKVRCAAVVAVFLKAPHESDC